MKIFEGPPIGPEMVTAGLDEVLEAMEAVPADLDWPTLADRVVPAFQRVRPYPPGQAEPLRILVPPGLSVGFAIDIGPAFLNIDSQLIGRWGLTAAELLARALDNLDRRMGGVSPDDVLDASIDDQPIRVLQSRTGCASTYVLLPASLGRIFGSEPHLVIAPMRNLLISLPIDTDREFAAWLFDEFAARDPNCLAPAAFVIRAGWLSAEPLGNAIGRA
ncbi:MAG: hypothetical protein WEE50_04300 [Chloroflexota bacterium]